MAKFVTGSGEHIREIELPDDVRVATEEDAAALSKIKQDRLEREKSYEARVAREQKKLEKERRISELKRLLNQTDYQAIKFAEGEISAEDYEEVKVDRRAWREEINAIQEEVKSL